MQRFIQCVNKSIKVCCLSFVEMITSSTLKMNQNESYFNLMKTTRYIKDIKALFMMNIRV